MLQKSSTSLCEERNDVKKESWCNGLDAADFLRIACKIMESRYEELEAAMRTVVSRAYYSSFLKCKQCAIRQGQIQLRQYDRDNFPRKGEVHVAVRNAMFEIGLGHVAGELLDLFERRVVADYKLRKTVDRGDAEDAIELSMRIAQNIQPYE